jgi:histidine ammonia-lyase
MGVTAAQKARQILENVEYVTAIELLCAAQAVDFRGPEKLGRGTRKAYEMIRRKVSRVRGDRILSGDIEKIKDLVGTGKLLMLYRVSCNKCERYCGKA